MPSPPAPEKPTWRRRRTRRRNLNRDAVRAPLRPRRGRLAGKSVPGGGAGHCPATQAGRAVLLLLDAARLSARLGHTSGCRGREPPPGPAAPATAFRAAPEAAEAPLAPRGGVHTPGPRLADGPGERQLGRRGARRDSGGSGRRPAGAETPRGGGEDGDLTSQWQTDRRHVDRTNSNRWFLRLLTYQSVLQRMDFFF